MSSLKAVKLAIDYIAKDPSRTERIVEALVTEADDYIGRVMTPVKGGGSGGKKMTRQEAIASLIYLGHRPRIAAQIVGWITGHQESAFRIAPGVAGGHEPIVMKATDFETIMGPEISRGEK